MIRGVVMGAQHNWGNGRGLQAPKIHKVYKVVPSFKLFPFVWYDLVCENWITDGLFVPVGGKTKEVLAKRKPLQVVEGMRKLFKED
jgi:hypothetical protein